MSDILFGAVFGFAFGALFGSTIPVERALIGKFVIYTACATALFVILGIINYVLIDFRSRVGPRTSEEIWEDGWSGAQIGCHLGLLFGGVTFAQFFSRKK